MMTVPRVKKVWDKQRIKQLVGTIAAITVFEIFLVKWNSTLENEAMPADFRHRDLTLNV